MMTKKEQRKAEAKARFEAACKAVVDANSLKYSEQVK